VIGALRVKAVEVATAVERPHDPGDLDRAHPDMTLPAGPQPTTDVVELEQLAAVAHQPIVT
jgi:hypothetical protein